MDDRPRWRGDVARILPYRETIRRILPGPNAGLVVLDIDLLVRCYGQRYGTDHIGKFKFVEVKCAHGALTGGQWHMFPLIDEMLRTADPGGDRYCGFFVVTTEDEDWQICASFDVMRMHDRKHFVMSPANYWRWLNFEIDVDHREDL